MWRSGQPHLLAMPEEILLHQAVAHSCPQHFINVFCPCGKYSYQRDYVLRHQRISRCHTGYVFAVDQATFPEFRDLILPQVANPHKRAILGQEFSPCRAIQEVDGEPAAALQPAATQPLRVVLARVGAGARPGTSTCWQLICL